jgi:GTP-binding protein YchF
VVYAKVTYGDIAGLGEGQGEISGALLNKLSPMDGFVHVVRCFEDASVLHVLGSVDPGRDVRAMDEELLLNDQIKVEGKLERLQDEWRKGTRDKTVIEREISLFKRLNTALQEEKPLCDMEFSYEEEKLLAGYGFLTCKPMLIMLNLGEEQSEPQVIYDRQHSRVVALQGKLEMEIAQLPTDEVPMFLQEFGINEPGLSRVIRESYDLMNLQSFFTGNENEVHAWTVNRGATVLEAAGEVHSDMQRGFIRAEVVAYEDLAALGNLAEARAQGKLRLEGKNYIVQDGDLINIRFNI